MKSRTRAALMGATILLVSLTVAGTLSLPATADPTVPSPDAAEQMKKAGANRGQPEQNDPPPPENIRAAAVLKVLALIPTEQQAGTSVPDEGPLCLYVARPGADKDPALARAIAASGYEMTLVVVPLRDQEVTRLSEASRWISQAPEGWADTIAAIDFNPAINGVTLEVMPGWPGSRGQAERLMGVPVTIQAVETRPTFTVSTTEENPLVWGGARRSHPQQTRP